MKAEREGGLKLQRLNSEPKTVSNKATTKKMKLNQKQVQHLFNRAGFGIRYDRINQHIGKSPEVIVDEIFQYTKAGKYLKRAKKDDFKPPNQGSPDARKAFFERSRKMIFHLNLDWLMMMSSSEHAFREKMTLFWHGHFASTSNNAFLVQQQHNLLKKNALGNFKDLLHAVSKDAVMLQYLNNQQNRKHAPNENFAREVMELFTIGRGNYSEQDIREAARAFTGWGFNGEGKFVFRRRIHDAGLKTILGKTGYFNGDDVLTILLQQKQTAFFLTDKIYRFFVNEETPNERVRLLAEEFYDSKYDIQKLMRRIFTAPWFYDDSNIGCKIKSPVELLVSAIMHFQLDLGNAEAMVGIQKLLGQILFRPPNVSGWPAGKQWIDASTLMLRLRLTEAMLASAGMNSGEFIAMLHNNKVPEKLMKMKITMDWQVIENQFKRLNENDFEKELCQHLISSEIDKEKINLLKPKPSLPRKYKLFTTMLKISKLPEFQFC